MKLFLNAFEASGTRFSFCIDAEFLSLVPVPFRDLINSHSEFFRDLHLLDVRPDRVFVELLLQDVNLTSSLMEASTISVFELWGWFGFVLQFLGFLLTLLTRLKLFCPLWNLWHLHGLLEVSLLHTAGWDSAATVVLAHALRISWGFLWEFCILSRSLWVSYLEDSRCWIVWCKGFV